jgi:mevalonate kinase
VTIARAPGKAILFGEHAVVYGRPAIAVPVSQVAATAEVSALAHGDPGDVWIEAPDIHASVRLSQAAADDPLALIVRLTLEALAPVKAPALRLVVHSTVPMAAGLGSGAAMSVAIVRALSAHLGRSLPLERQSELAFEVEKLHHGTPSGIDNTVVTFAQPVYYQRGLPPARLTISAPFHLVLGDTGRASPTSVAVGRVRESWQANRKELEATFDSIASLVEKAREAIATDTAAIGPLMDQNQTWLERLGVSSPELDRLIAAARRAGAAGAKLSGAGMGGNMIACVAASDSPAVEAALRAAGAVRTIATEVSA